MKTLTAIHSFIDSRRSSNLSPITIDWYLKRLTDFAVSYPSLPKDARNIERFLSSVKGEENKHGYYRTLKVLYRFLRKRYRVPNPVELIEPPRRPKKIMATLEPGEMMRLMHSPEKLRDKVILFLLRDTGIRSSELAGLCKKVIGQETITVNGKSGQRQVPISEETRHLLHTLIEQNGDKSEIIFHGERGALSRSGVYRIVSAHMKKAGISGPKLGGHRIRHAFGKNYLVSGGDLRSLQELMGHKRITTTEKYTNLSKKDLIDKHHQFTPLKAAYAAAQESLWKDEAVKEAEELLTKKEIKNDHRPSY
jgi:integrase/recombinase XerD